MTDNATLAKRIVELDRELSLTKNLLESSMLSEATAKQYAEEVDKQNKELTAQVGDLEEKLLEMETTLAKKDSAICNLEQRVWELEDDFEKRKDQELDVLKAQVEALRMIAILVHFEWANNVVTFNTMQRLYSVVNSTPQQHLAEIRAEAGRDGYLQGVHDCQLAEINYEDFDTQSRSAQYADSIRKGEVK